MAMRAVSKDFETAQLMGIKINRVISMTFVIGSLLAAVGSHAVLHQLHRHHPHWQAPCPGLKAFVAAVFGGIGSMPGAVVGRLSHRHLRESVQSSPSDCATSSATPSPSPC